MEKRRVRIYKAGGQQDSNKLLNFFQEGGMQEEQQMQPTQELDDNQIISIIMQRLSQEDGTGDINYAKQELSQMNIEPARIDKLSNYVLNYIDDQKSLRDAQETGDEETAAKLQEEEYANDQQAQVEQEEEALQQQRQQQLQEMYSQDSVSNDDAMYDEAEAEVVMRNGGMPNKRAYISNFIKLAKKQEGGNAETSKPDISTDRPIDGREERIGKFHNALKLTANNAALKQQAEDAYNQQMQQMQQMPPQGYAQNGGTQFPNQDEDPENPMHHIGAYATGIHDIFDNPQVGTSSGPDEFQFGGWGQGKERRAARRMNRMLPQGFNPMGNMMGNQMNPLAQFMPNQGNLGLANIDVHRTGMFGRPKEYTINFNTVTPIKQQDIEDTKKQLINNADEVVKEAETNIKAETTNTSTEKNTEVLKAEVELPTAENITIVNNDVKNSSGKNIPGASSNTPDVVKDQWGRPEGSEWYNYDPNTKKPITIKHNTKHTPYDTFYYADDKPGNYYRLNDGRLYSGNEIKDDRIEFNNEITDPNRIKQLQTKLKGSDLYSLKSKPGYYYRQRADGSYVKFKGDPLKHDPSNKQISIITPKDSGYNYIKNNRFYERAYTPKKQQGGFVDPESGLYKFMGGGEDFSQMDLDFTNSKNVSSPYFEVGGYLPQAQKGMMTISDGKGNTKLVSQEDAEIWNQAKVDTPDISLNDLSFASDKPVSVNDKQTVNTNTNNIDYAQRYLQSIGMQYNPFSPGQAITAGGNWNKTMGKPYSTQTGNPISGMIGPNAQVSSIKVDKTRKFGPNKGAAKKFTVNYNVPGQTGINATGTPQSYKGSDGQMHWMTNQSQTSQGNQEAGRKRPVADMLLRSKIPGLQQLGAKMTPWEGGNPSEPMGIKYSKSDEAYKEHFGHYPGEGKPEYTEVGALPTRKLVREEPQLVENNIEESIPVGALPTRKNVRDEPQLIEPRTGSLPFFPINNTEEIIPEESIPVGALPTRELENNVLLPNLQKSSLLSEPSTSETSFAPMNDAGPMVGEQDMQENTQTEFDLPQSESIDYMQSQLYNAPNEYDNYNPYISNQEEAAQYFNENLQGPGYMPENPLLNMEHYDSSNDFELDPITQQPVRVNRNRSNVNRTVPTVNQNNSNRSQINTAPIKEINQPSRAYTPPSISESYGQDKRDADVYNRSQEHQQNIQNNRQNFQKEYGVDKATLEMYLSLQGQPNAIAMEKMNPGLKKAADKYKMNEEAKKETKKKVKELMNWMPKAQFGSTGERPKAPLGYYDNPNRSGLTTNMAGDVYSPKTNLQGKADKLMENPFMQQGNGLTTDNSMGFNAEGTGYRNEGLLTDQEKEQQASQQVSQKFKNKQEWNIDPLLALEKGNQFGNTLLGFAENFQDAKQNRNFGSKFDASNMYATTSGRDRGTYDQLGQFKPDETGFKGVVKYGGYMEEGGSYEEGGDTWMSEEQIQRFLAEGGELEFV